MKHDYHFVLTKALKNKIYIFADNNSQNLSEAVVYIFNFMKPMIEKHYLKDLSCIAGDYSCFGSNADMHVYFDKTDYKYLRQVQSNLYCFSMAIVLRWVLNEFFNGISLYGVDRFCKVIKRFGKIFLGKDKFFEKSNKRHMFYSCENYQYISHIFDNKYNLIKTKFT